MKKIKIGFAMCGSFCTLQKSIEQIDKLKEKEFDIIPIMSETTYNTDTRFGKAADFVWIVQDMCGKPVIKEIKEAEPLGPKKMVDILVISPCTGNTLAKISNGITDTSVTMAAKSCLRIGIPVLLALASNDALGANAKNIGSLMNTKNVYFVPFGQDDPKQKPTSLVAKFDLLLPSVTLALDHEQIQPLLQ